MLLSSTPLSGIAPHTAAGSGLALKHCYIARHDPVGVNESFEDLRSQKHTRLLRRYVDTSL